MSVIRARRLFVGLIALAAPHLAAGQQRAPITDQLDHTVWGLRDGAPSFIDALAQTTDGVLWLGTNTGLFRFDGFRFERFEPSAQPSAQLSFLARPITAMLGMPDGTLWVGFSAGDVRAIARDTVVTYTPFGTAGGRISRIVRDSAGDVWVSSLNGLARLHDGRWRRIGREENFPSKDVGSLLVDSRGALWVATSTGVYVLPRGGTEFVQQAASPTPTRGGFRTPTEAPDGSVWAASLTLGLTRLSDSAGRPTVSPLRIDGIGPTVAAHFDHRGDVWITGLVDGLTRMRLPAPAPAPAPARSSRPAIERVPLITAPYQTALLEDADGSIWIGTGGGLERFRQTALTAVALPKDTRWPGIAAAADGSIWLGSISRPVSSITAPHSLPGAPSNITAVLRDLEGGVWFGGTQGIWHLAPNSSAASAHFAAVPLPSAGTFGSVIAMARARNGDLWVSSGATEATRGVFRLHDGVWSRAPLPEAVSHTAALTVIADSAGQVWLGSRNQLLRVRRDSLRIFVDTAHFRPGVILTLQSHGPRIWIGGKTGIAVLEDEQIHPITANIDIRDVTGIIETANGDVWLNSGAGVVHLPAADVRRALTNSQYRVRAERFDEHDGLSGVPLEFVPRPTAVQGVDGRLWFATSTSVAWIDPLRLVQSRKPPPVQIRALTAAGETYDLAHRISLPVRTTQLQLAYTAVSLAKPSGIVFRYRLAGVDTAWIDAGTRREAFYTNLKPGAYNFRVSAANEDGVWNESGATLDFDIPPSFTQTRAFVGTVVALLALGLLGAGWLLALWRHRQMAQALHAKFEGQLAERARVARELHDTLLGDMIGVALQLSVAANRTATADNKDLLSSLSKQVQHTVVEARKSVSAIRTAPDKPVPLHEQLANAAHRAFRDTPIAARVVHTGSPRAYADEVESQIVAIATEAMTNASRHANCRTVTIVCAYAAHDIHVRVRDDGEGFDSSRATPSGHWGLIGMRERAAGIGATLSVSSKRGAGTEVSISAHNAPTATRA
ncbi:MAG TPA: two-component regulator propeller domain-containing protein [Gemmatimonadaceae bacterium]|jgi:signal transduction histidine kinase